MELRNSMDTWYPEILVSTGNSGGTGNAWNEVTGPPAGGQLVYDDLTSSNGPLSVRMKTAGTSGGMSLAWSFSALSQVWVSVYCYMALLPTSTAQLFAYSDTVPQVSVRASVAVNSSGNLLVRDSAGATQATSTTVFPTGRWVRLESFCVGSATVGQLELNVFASDRRSVTSNETLTTGANLNTGGTVGAVYFGDRTAFPANWYFGVDSAAVSSVVYPGPWTGLSEKSQATMVSGGGCVL